MTSSGMDSGTSYEVFMEELLNNIEQTILILMAYAILIEISL